MKTLEQIAAALDGYDPQALRADTALAFLLDLVAPVRESTQLPLKESLGRVLAHDLAAPVDVPPHDNAAMDGYAFSGACLEAGDATISLHCVGSTAFAGKPEATVLAPGQCQRVMTGAVMPAGTDTVVPQELATAEGAEIRFSRQSLRRGDNRRLRGEDLQRGQCALAAGTRLTPAALGLAASLGLTHVSVLRKIRVAYFSTGDEILQPGEPGREGAVYDSNRFTLFGVLTQLGVELLDLGVVQDDPVALETAFAHASAQADAIITSGGVSVGEADHTKAVMRKMAGGADGVAFWRIAMRPGRPMAVGRVGRTVLFGLPGNPVAVMVTYLAFVQPALLRMMGCAHKPAPLLAARSAQAIRKKPGRTEYQRGIVERAADGVLEVRSTGQQGSGVLSSMVQANALMVLGHDQGDVAVGDSVDVMLLANSL